MRVFARLIKHPLDIPIERPQHVDARMHQRPTIFRGHDQRLDRCLPRFKILFGLRKQDRVIEGTSPSGNGLHLRNRLSVFRDVLNVQFALSSVASAAAIAGPIVALS
jgi:hypothetical protein